MRITNVAPEQARLVEPLLGQGCRRWDTSCTDLLRV